MPTLKYKLTSGWKTIYGALLNKMLRKDKNLADIDDPAEACANLGLSGSNVITHSHDQRYFQLGNNLSELNTDAKRKAAVSNLGIGQAGSATQPVYIASGEFKSTTYALHKTVPADAIFTDTKVTNTNTVPSSATWYPVSSTTADTATGTLVKAPTIQFHTANGTASSQGYDRLYLGNATTAGTDGNKTGGVLLYGNTGKYALVQPSANAADNYRLYTPNKSGTLVAHTTGTAAGSATKPCYVNADGVATACSYSLEKSVPADAVFTDHTYASFIKSGATAAAGLVPKPSTTAGTTKFLREDATWATPVDTTYAAFVKSGTTSAAGLVPKPPTTAGTTKFLREDATWATPVDTTYAAFVKSGTTSAAGLVPKPPTTAGTTKFLREDATWATPVGTTYAAFVKSGTTAATGLVPKPPTTAGTTKFLREDATWTDVVLPQIQTYDT